MQDAGKEDYLRPSERIGLDSLPYTMAARTVGINKMKKFSSMSAVLVVMV